MIGASLTPLYRYGCLSRLVNVKPGLLSNTRLLSQGRKKPSADFVKKPMMERVAVAEASKKSFSRLISESAYMTSDGRDIRADVEEDEDDEFPRLSRDSPVAPPSSYKGKNPRASQSGKRYDNNNERNSRRDRHDEGRQSRSNTSSNSRDDTKAARPSRQSRDGEYFSRPAPSYGASPPQRSSYGRQSSSRDSGSKHKDLELKENLKEGEMLSRTYRKYGDNFDENHEPVYGRYSGDHVFGISPVRLALSANRRTIVELLMQSGMDIANKKDDKTASEILAICKEKNIPVREFTKHDLNMVTENKVHQGFVLRAEPLEFTPIKQLEKQDNYSCVLALDEVWDPMNFGALVRTAYFLGVDKVVICAKNSAPLSPTVSKASSGAVELMEIFSTNNLMNFLDKSVENGWQVVGTDLGKTSIKFTDVPLTKPTILVLGNEGSGVRTNIRNRCTHLVKIAGASRENEDELSSSMVPHQQFVDSLNVSVTGGILMHHLISARNGETEESE